MAESTFPGTNPFGGGGFGTTARGSSGNIHKVAEEDEHAADPTSRVSAGSDSANPFSGSNSNFSFGQTSSADSKPPSAFRLGVNDGDGGLPSNYHMTRRTSVSAESLNPSAADDNWKPPYHAKSADQIDRLKASVSSNFLFSHLPDESSSVVLGALVEKPIPAKDIKVISQGDAGDYFYVVEKGTFDIYINSTGSIEPGPQGMGNKVNSIGPGGSFGELALMYNAPRAATVISTEPNSNLWALDRVTFRRILMDSAFQRRRMYESFLEEVPLLSSLTLYERSKIADALETQKFGDGQTIIQEGDKGEAFFMVEQGEAEVYKKDAGEKAIKLYKKGDYFGELALLDDKPRAASVVAKGECKVATLGKDGFQRLLGSVEAIMRRTDYSQTGKEGKEIGQ
ncbi:MAG: hypothetical protein L6R38_004063 [Xanthoria sp. 2 TBL-2021]|nr:MAG: hypothetical protein L6R38_004063 [Xanthoria sp. 2 TBL-2021]